MRTEVAIYLDGPNEGGIAAASSQGAVATAVGGEYMLAVRDDGDDDEGAGVHASVTMSRAEVLAVLGAWAAADPSLLDDIRGPR